MTDILIGIDGGASKTHLLAADTKLNIKTELTGSGCNYLAIGLSCAVDNLSGLIQKAVNSIHQDGYSYYVTIGTAGAGRKDDIERLTVSLKESLKNMDIPCKEIMFMSDAVIALEGAFEGKVGVILNCGTGSFVFGKDKEGNIHRAGGFGRLIGDEGSGYSIGRKGITLISKMMDDRISESEFYNAFIETTGITNGAELINNIYKLDFEIPSVAPLVISCADNDKLCRDILDEEVDELILHLEAIKNKMKTDDFNLVLMGSLINEENYYSTGLRAKIKEYLPEVKIIEPVKIPAYGALLFSQKMPGN